MAEDYQGEGRNLFNLSDALERALLPEASDVAGTGSVGAEGRSTGSELRQSLLGSLDVIGIPGRAIASLPSLFNDDETYLEALGRTEALEDTNLPSKFVSNTLRDPITALLAVASGGSSAAKQPVQEGSLALLKKLGSYLGNRTIEALPETALRQASESLKTGEVDIGEQSKDFATDLLSDVALNTGIDLGKKGLKRVLDPEALKRALNSIPGNLTDESGALKLPLDLPEDPLFNAKGKYPKPERRPLTPAEKWWEDPRIQYQELPYDRPIEYVPEIFPFNFKEDDYLEVVNNLKAEELPLVIGHRDRFFNDLVSTRIKKIGTDDIYIRPGEVRKKSLLESSGLQED